MLNTAFCALLFATVAYIGNLFARQVEQRPGALTDMRAALDTLKTRLHYCNEPIRTALENTSRELRGGWADIFALAAERMAAGDVAEHALESAINTSRQQGGAAAPLTRQDIDIVTGLARRIGGDAASQQAAFGMAFATLNGLQSQAQQQKQARGRLYRTGGLLTGALLAVLFI